MFHRAEAGSESFSPVTKNRAENWSSPHIEQDKRPELCKAQSHLTDQFS